MTAASKHQRVGFQSMGPGRRRRGNDQVLILFLIFLDLVWVLVAYTGSFLSRMYLPLPLTTDFLPISRMTAVGHPVVFILTTQLAILYFFSFYDLPLLKQRQHLVPRVTTALGLQLLGVAAWFFFLGDLSFPRSVLVIFWLVNVVGVVTLRLWFIKKVAKSGLVRVLLVGTSEDVRMFLVSISELRHVSTHDIVGMVGLQDTPQPPEPGLGIPWLGRIQELPKILEEVVVDETILLSPTGWKDTFVDRLARLSQEQLMAGRPRVLVVPSVYDILVGRVSSLRLQDVPLVEVLKNPKEEIAFLLKSACDTVAAAALLVLFLPVIVISAILVKLSSRGPVLYRQSRVGRDGQEFVLYKLRTMVDDAEALTGPVLARSGDDRVTQVGRFLRATRIDELPQLVNVLNGSMSLVGPRPERPEFVNDYYYRIPGYSERFQVKPGLTGLAQVNGEYHTTPEYKLKYDLAYIYNYTLWLDVRVLAETIKVILTKRGI